MCVLWPCEAWRLGVKLLIYISKDFELKVGSPNVQKQIQRVFLIKLLQTRTCASEITLNCAILYTFAFARN